MVVYHGWGWGERINGTDESDDLFGEGGDDDIFGGKGSDFLQGGEGDDEIFGGADNDVLVSGVREPRITPPGPPPPIGSGLPGLDKPDGGNDEMFGGSGNDRLIVTTDSASVHADGGSGTDTLQIGFDDQAVADFLEEGGPPQTQTDAAIDLEQGFGIYRFNGSLISIDLTITGVENVDGSAFNETISGTDDANILNGELGNDMLRGRGGADVLNGGSGNDTAIYDDSAALVDIDMRSSIQRGGDAQGDRFSSIENVTGSRFSDFIRGNAAANILIGNGGSDILEGREGADTINGGSGSDTASYESSRLRVVVDLRSSEAQSGGDAAGDILSSIENLIGSQWDDILTGNNNANVLTGGLSNDVLSGEGGNDTLEGGFGNDTLNGGEGIDIASYLNATAGVQVILGQNGADGRATAQFPVNDVDTLRSIEAVFGSNHNDAMFGNDQINIFRGHGGDDYFLESRGNDQYIGDAGIDTIDFSVEEAGVSVNLANGTITHAGSSETDSVASVERIAGSGLNDTIVGSAAAEFLFGQGGEDTFDGGLGNDLLNGGSGNDTAEFGSWGTPPPSGGIFFIASQVTVRLGANGADGVATRSMLGSVLETDTLRGIENARGSNNRDLLIGNELDNNLFGEEGDDTIVGGSQLDIDRLTGGAGSDTFLYQSRDDSRSAKGATGDFIQDFEIGEDAIDLGALRVNAASLLIQNRVIDGINFSTVTEDINGNGGIDLGEFSFNVRIEGAGFVTLQDILL
jgi:Ca2+-binding RTX toxin-like protein